MYSKHRKITTVIYIIHVEFDTDESTMSVKMTGKSSRDIVEVHTCSLFADESRERGAIASVPSGFETIDQTRIACMYLPHKQATLLDHLKINWPVSNEGLLVAFVSQVIYMLIG